MELSAVLQLAVLLGLAGACPVYQCQQMSRGVCAEVVDGVVTVNSIGCPAREYCFLSLLQEGAALVTKSTLLCAELAPLRYFNFGGEENQCQSRDPLARLSEGVHPKLCTQPESDPACLLANGDYAACDCGLDGQKYCRYSSGDGELAGLYQSCEDYEGQPGRAELEYWTVYKQYAHVASTAPACLSKAIYELELLASRSNGQWQVLAGLLLTQLLI